MYSGAVVKVCTNSQQNNKNTTVLHFKTGDFAKFCQKFSPQGWVLDISSVFHQKRNPLEPTYVIHSVM